MRFADYRVREETTNMCDNVPDLIKAVGALSYDDYREVTKNAKQVIEISARVLFKRGDKVAFTARNGTEYRGHRHGAPATQHRGSDRGRHALAR